MPEVGEILGSKSGLPPLEAFLEQLQEFEIEAGLTACSARRDPARVMERAGTAREPGSKVVIAAAGRPLEVNDGEVAARHGERRRALAGR